MAKTSKSEMDAVRRWAKHNKAKRRYYQYKSRANTFINKYATDLDMMALVQKIMKKLKKD